MQEGKQGQASLGKVTSLPAAEHPPGQEGSWARSPAPPTLSTLCSPRSLILEGSRGRGTQQSGPNPLPHWHVSQRAVNCAKGLEERKPPVGVLTQQFSHNSFFFKARLLKKKRRRRKKLGSIMETVRRHVALFERTHWFQRPRLP